jgi:hypothetical protein
LTPGSGIRSGMVNIRIRIRYEQGGSYFRELRKKFFGLKYSNSLMRIWDPGWKKLGSGNRDKHPGSATLLSKEDALPEI